MAAASGFPSFYQFDNQEAPDRFRWRTSNPAVVLVDGRGYVSAVGEGTASISVSSGRLRSSPLSVIVVAARPPEHGAGQARPASRVASHLTSTWDGGSAATPLLVRGAPRAPTARE